MQRRINSSMQRLHSRRRDASVVTMTTRPRLPRSSKTKVTPRKKARTAYHHGNLRQVLIEATLRLVEEGGPEAVTVREAARRAGVSPGAPFRHFPTRTSLMTAVAEEATHRLHDAVFAAVASNEAGDPLNALRAMGRAYLRWAYANPTHFAIVSDRRLIDYESSESIVRENREMQALMVRLVIDARKRGLAAEIDPAVARLASRALVYGLARMRVDGHLSQWGVQDARSTEAAEAVIDLFIDGLMRAGRPEAPAPPRRRPRSGP
jgi:AcrR family transcriptional regulator